MAKDKTRPGVMTVEELRDRLEQFNIKGLGILLFKAKELSRQAKYRRVKGALKC